MIFHAFLKLCAQSQAVRVKTVLKLSRCINDRANFKLSQGITANIPAIWSNKKIMK